MLRFDAVQYPGGNIFEATHYTSPYNVQLAALESCDWIKACQKYREQYRGFSYYNGPIGSP